MTETPSSVLAAALRDHDIVDLTVTLAEDLPGAWPTHVPFQRKLYSYFGFRGPYHTAFVLLDEHCGTHIDAPSHFIPPLDSGLPNAAAIGAVNAEQLDLTKMMGPAAVIDVTALTGTGGDGRSPEITADHVRQWEAAHGPLQPGDIVLFRSDWDARYQRFPAGNQYVFDGFMLKQGPGWPSPDLDCLAYLHERGITTLGLDGVSVGAMHDPVPAHLFGLAKGMLYIELLTNLAKLPPRGATFIFLPIKIEGGSAGPGRAVGLIPRR